MNKPALCSLLLLALSGCDPLFSGLPDDAAIFDAPLDGLSPEQLRSFAAGDEAFGELFTAQTGLGPVFNAPSCETCHTGEGKSHPTFNLRRFGRGNPSDSSTFDYLPELGGAQLQDRAIPGYVAEILPEQVAVSERSGPIVVGLGLIEAIPAEAILSRVDPMDLDGDGLSGRANYVLPPDFVDTDGSCTCAACKPTPAGCKQLGRFGRKATAIGLLQQTVTAYHEDMGVMTDQLVNDVYNPQVGGPSGDFVADPEVASSTVSSVVFYLRTLRPPLRRGTGESDVQRGEGVFASIGCAGCHVPVLRSGPSAIAALNDRDVALYSDLLLHDLGPELADHYPEGEATGDEWRTTPLWGLGIVPNLLGGREFYLHDGRARSLEEAISLHGGEAQSSKQAFLASSSEDRSALLAFLRSR